MRWNYRIVKIEPSPLDNALASPYYGFITAWYSNSGKLNGWSGPPAAPYGCTLSELKGDVTYFIRGFEKEVLLNSAFEVPFGPPYNEVPMLVIDRTTYPQPKNELDSDLLHEEFVFLIVNKDGSREPFVPTATSIDLLRSICAEMMTVIENQQTLST